MQAEYTYKPVTETSHLVEIVELQNEIWGREVVTTLPQLVAAIHNGGAVIAAWHEEKIIGFCYGFAGLGKKGETPYLVSHMMGISEKYRDQGIGEQLKWKQREWALTFGYEKIKWTFDPLEVRNGYLNLYKLGGYVDNYIESYYGEMKDKVNNGLPSDRFLVEWDLLSLTVQQACKGNRKQTSKWNAYGKLLNYEKKGKHPIPVPCAVQEAGYGYLMPVPKDIQQLKAESLELSKEWRMIIRQEMKQIFAKGYRVVGFIPGNDIGYYVFEPRSAVPSVLREVRTLL